VNRILEYNVVYMRCSSVITDLIESDVQRNHPEMLRTVSIDYSESGKATSDSPFLRTCSPTNQCSSGAVVDRSIQITYLKLGYEVDGPAQRFAEEMNDVDEGYRQDVQQISEWFQKIVEPLEQFPEGIGNVP